LLLIVLLVFYAGYLMDESVSIGIVRIVFLGYWVLLGFTDIKDVGRWGQSSDVHGKYTRSPNNGLDTCRYR
jgi:hypothetical protein